MEQLLGENVIINDDLLSPPLKAFRKAFIHFANILEEEGYRTNFLDEKEAPETTAYWAFWGVISQLVKS